MAGMIFQTRSSVYNCVDYICIEFFFGGLETFHSVSSLIVPDSHWDISPAIQWLGVLT